MTVIVIPAGGGGPVHWYDVVCIVVPLVLAVILGVLFWWDD